jgi:tyrosyl-tRNA synthetase
MKINTDSQKINEVLTRGVAQIYPSKKALNSLLKKKRIRLYQGFDPSMPSLHLGNLVGILKMKQFQELGHEVLFLVGDFTGMIGDPTDKLSARKKLTREQVLENTKNWKEEISKFLDFSGDNPAKILFNSEWLDKISFKDLIEITSHFTVQRMIERDFFQTRIKEGKAIFLHEFLYPIAQAIDCVKMDVDLEIGGSDQMFNMMVGRDLMKAIKGKEKFILTMKLLTGKEGKKIGKTTGGAVFLNTQPEEMFGQIMSFPDEVIIPGFELLSTVPLARIEKYEKELKFKKVNPRNLKKELAFEIVKLNYGEKVAKKASQEFENVFKEKMLPTKIPEIKIEESSLDILDLLVKTKKVSSKSEAKRIILQKGVKINGTIQENWRENVDIKKGMIIQIGRRKFVKVS